MVPNSAKCSQIVPIRAKWCKIVPNNALNSAKWCQMPNVSKWCQMVPNVPKRSQMVPNDGKWWQIVENGAKWCKMVLDVAIWCQVAGELGQWARSGGCWVRESSSGQSEGTAGADCLEEEALGKKSGLTAAANRARHKLFIYQARECSLVSYSPVPAVTVDL